MGSSGGCQGEVRYFLNTAHIEGEDHAYLVFSMHVGTWKSMP